MGGSKNSLPLAFLLAMTANITSSPALEKSDNKPILEPGMFAGLVHETLYNPAPNESPESYVAPGQRTAQYFPNFPNFQNFSNCFLGNFRNC